MRKKVAGLVVVLLVLVAVGGISFWWLMEQPFYEPGMVRSGKNLRGSLVPPKQTAEGPYWLAEADIRLFYHTQGTGRPVIVLHGGPGYPVHQPLAAVEPLARNCQFYYYDQRGCGRSTRPFDRFESQNFYGNMKELERTLGIGAQVADIERIRNILGQEKLILMGHSFGAFLAAMYAAEFPERIEVLVLVAPAGVLVLPDKEGGLFEEIRVHLPDDQRDGYDRFLKEYLDFGQVFSKSEEDLAKLNRRFGGYFLTAAGARTCSGGRPTGQWGLDGSGDVLQHGKAPRLQGSTASIASARTGSPRGGRFGSRTGQPHVYRCVTQRHAAGDPSRQGQRRQARRPFSAQ
jgi:proline iminopeptidase